MKAQEMREQILHLIYEMKNAPESEKAEWRGKLDQALDDARGGTSASRSDVYGYLYRTYYRDYCRNRRRRENSHV